MESLNHGNAVDLICMSHLRWDFVFQRPQHLMSRFAKHRRVFFVEEPIFDGSMPPVLFIETCPHTAVHIVTPHLERTENANEVIRVLLEEMTVDRDIVRPIAWFYTPMALQVLPPSLRPRAVVYDCMDELSMFRGAPPELREQEDRLFKMADLVFTGGVSLYEYKRGHHPHVYPFPSGVDVPHFKKSRQSCVEPVDQREIPHPRLGFAGVIDERFDLGLLEAVASQKPDWHFVMLGPIAKISPESLPRRENIHWLGMKSYNDLPHYFGGWDVGVMPFALNDSTRFISPTKTPEYLAAGLPVISTPIRDVVRPYGERQLARISHSPSDFVAHGEELLQWDEGPRLSHLTSADEFLKTISWDSVWKGMNELVIGVVSAAGAVSARTASPRRERTVNV